MIIYLDVSISQHLAEYKLSDAEKMFYYELALAHKRGDCLLCGDIETLSALMEVMQEDLYKNIYGNIRAHYANVKSLINLVESVLYITYNETPVIPDFLSEKARILETDDAIRYNICKKCTLVTENLRDAVFYENVAKRYLLDNKIRGLELSLHAENGGGGTTSEVFQKCVETDKCLTLCIADSDISYRETEEYPEKPLQGGTYDAVKKRYDRLSGTVGEIICELYCIPAHEIENLIPISVIEYAMAHFKGSIEKSICALKIVRGLISNGLENDVLIYDYKKGASIDEVSPSCCYWKKVSEKIEETVFRGFNNKVLTNSFQALNDEDNKECHYKEVKIDDFLAESWEKVGRKVFTWGCANQPIRA